MFEDREQAGLLLAKKLLKYKARKNVIVVGLARGGVVVAKVVSLKLKLPLDVMVIKKIGAPLNPELAIGAVAPKNTVFWSNDLIKQMNISLSEKYFLKKLKEKERKEQEIILRGRKTISAKGGPVSGWDFKFKDKTVILVDDGVATGASVLAAHKFLRKVKTKEVILAVPVIARDTLRDIREYFDDVIILKVKSHFYAVGQFYKNFPQVSNEEVISLLK